MSLSTATATPARAAAAARSSRLGLRTTEAQETILRRAAEVSQKSLTDFILDSACLAAEQTLLDQRLFVVSGTDAQAFIRLLDRPAKSNAGLKRLFAKPSPWESGAESPRAKK